MRYQDWLSTATHRLKGSGSTSPQLDASLLLRFVLGLSEERLFIDQSSGVIPADSILKLERLLKRRLRHEPLAYILGAKDFYGLSFAVDKRALIPRPESEALVEWVIRSASHGANLLDIGTGSGNLAIAIKYHRPDITMAACDIDPQALELAKINAKKHQVDIAFSVSDLFGSIRGRYDIISANLPYVSHLQRGRLSPELDFEPDRAIFAGSSGLALYKKLFDVLPDFLLDKGLFVFEHLPAQFGKLTELAQSHGFSLSSISNYISRCQKAPGLSNLTSLSAPIGSHDHQH